MKANILIKENEPLANHTTFRIGGPARFFVICQNSDEIKAAIEAAKSENIPFVVLGGGSNVLASDEGFDGLVIKIFGGEIKINGDEIICDSGVPLTKAMNESLVAGLIGLEWSAGIPGTIGGGVHNNCGAYGGEMADSVSAVSTLRNGEAVELTKEQCGFGYRESMFKQEGNHDVILSIRLKLKSTTPEEIIQAKEKIQKILAERKNKFNDLSAGSAFRNILMAEEEISGFKAKHPELPEQFVGYKKIPAAWLIDECGLKGRSVGGAKISENHAGIIINAGGATAKDVIMLTSIIKQKVRSKFSLQLMEEIEYIGF